MAGEVFSNPTQFQGFIDVAREQLGTIRAHPSSEPGPSSPAHLAFDPSISRHLKTFVPLRVIPVPAQEETWTAIDALLDGWQELSVLSRTNTLLTWEVRGYVHISSCLLMVFSWLAISGSGYPNRHLEFLIYGHLYRHVCLILRSSFY